VTVFLNGMRVLEVGDGVAGAWAGATFRDLGAVVSRLPLASCESAFGESAFGESLARGKQVVDAGSVEQALSMIGRPDVVICDRVERVRGDVPAGLGAYLDYVTRVNPSVWVSISAFGLSGPDAAEFGSDLTVSASAGVLAYVRDGQGVPRTLPGRQALLAAGQAAVLAGLHGVDQWRSAMGTVHMEVSAQEAMIATGPVLQCAEKMLGFTVRGGAQRFGAPAGWYECSDGSVYIATHEDHQWEGIKRATEAPDPIASMRTARDRIEHSGEIDAFIRAWTAHRTKGDVESKLQAEGVPATALNTLADVRESPMFAFRRRWRTDRLDGRSVTTMDAPYLLHQAERGEISPAAPRSAVPPPAVPRPAVPRRLADVKVAEASHILAASVAGSLLGAMGVNVVKVEDAGRLDQYRRAGPFIDGHDDLEWSGYFAVANHSKRSYVFRDQAELGQVIAGADAVIENWGISRARRLGVDCASVGSRWPDKLAVSSSGFGHDGPMAGYRVYAYNLNAYCGLLDILRGPAGKLPGLDFAWADFISAYGVATLVAAWAVGGAGPDGPDARQAGAQLDCSMAEIVIQRLNEMLIDDEPSGANDYVLATDGGDRYVTVTVTNDEDRRRLAGVAGVVGVAGMAGVADVADEQEVRSAFLATTADRAAGQLRAAGLMARAVINAEQLIRDDHLSERGFFSAVVHPEWGEKRLIGLPWRFAGRPAIALAPPPLLGRTDHAAPWER
jgi:crotonobetainyl-CoA:carnitine CoA-transferase CaiB-like acyl-CoA transferase